MPNSNGKKDAVMSKDFLEQVRDRAAELWEAHGLLREPVAVRARALSPEEAIGNPEAKDFPLQKGRERLMEAVFRGARGQAFTHRFGDFSGTLTEIAAMPLDNSFRRAVLVASLNATLRFLGLCDRTVHCRDEGPALCAAKLRGYLAEEHPGARVGLVGYQPAFVAALAPAVPLRVLDLDPENIGTVRHGVTIEGPGDQPAVLDWAEVILLTGSSLSNGTAGQFLGRRPVVVFGVTAAAAAALLGWERFCTHAS